MSSRAAGGGVVAAIDANVDNHNLPLPSAFQIRFNTDDQDEWPQEAALLAAAYNGNIHRLKEVATRLDADEKGMVSTLRHTNFEGVNVLHAAAGGSGLLPMCWYLVEEVGMDVSRRDTAGRNMTPLEHAVSAGNLHVFRYLFDKGADLHRASHLKDQQVVVIPPKDRREQSEEARKEELYHALSPQRTFVWHLYLYTIAMFTVLLIWRYFSSQVMLSMSMETTMAFTVVTIVYYGVVVHNSVWVTPLWVSDPWALGRGVWYYTACWMILYTVNIPPTLYESRQLGIACFFVVLTLAITLLSKVSRCAFLFGQG